MTDTLGRCYSGGPDREVVSFFPYSSQDALSCVGARVTKSREKLMTFSVVVSVSAQVLSRPSFSSVVRVYPSRALSTHPLKFNTHMRRSCMAGRARHGLRCRHGVCRLRPLVQPCKDTGHTDRPPFRGQEGVLMSCRWRAGGHLDEARCGRPGAA